MIYYFDLFGTLVFAISGTITGIDRRLDIFGATVVGLVTAVGGGTLRDLLIGDQPVSWIMDIHYFWMILSGVLLTLLFTNWMQRRHRTLLFFDALGIGVFTLLGTQKGMDYGLHPVIAIMMGMLSAVFGGVIRDVLCSQVPLIFRKEVYATVCLLGGGIYVLLLPLFDQSDWWMGLCIVMIWGLRLLAVRYHWSLPTLDRSNRH